MYISIPLICSSFKYSINFKVLFICLLQVNSICSSFKYSINVCSSHSSHGVLWMNIPFFVYLSHVLWMSTLILNIYYVIWAADYIWHIISWLSSMLLRALGPSMKGKQPCSVSFAGAMSEMSMNNLDMEQFVKDSDGLWWLPGLVQAEVIACVNAAKTADFVSSDCNSTILQRTSVCAFWFFHLFKARVSEGLKAPST